MPLSANGTAAAIAQAHHRAILSDAAADRPAEGAQSKLLCSAVVFPVRPSAYHVGSTKDYFMRNRDRGLLHEPKSCKCRAAEKMGQVH